MKKEYDFSKGTRGAVLKVAKGKTRITIRIDDDILEEFKDRADRSGGANYQSMINEALRESISKVPETLEKTLRKVIRDELGRAKPGVSRVAARSLSKQSTGRS